MKKLLLILICLFLSFESKSDEILLKIKCKTPLSGITFDTRRDDKNYSPDTILLNSHIEIVLSKDIILTLTKEMIDSDNRVINFKWGKENKNMTLIRIVRARGLWFQDDDLSKSDKDGYNIHEFHLTLDKMKLFYNRIVERGIFGNPPFDITNSIYSTTCKDITNNDNPPIPKNISPELPNTG